jgi:DNA mismatch endonuclease (patch repair protein)
MADYKIEEPIIVPRFNEESGFYTTKKRSILMGKIKSKNTSPEILLRKTLWKNGLRYRIHNKKLPGNPDISSYKYQLVIFIDGEFWHGHDWERKKGKIKSNRGFWIPKIERNMQRDRQNNLKLEEMGFKVLRFWGNDVKKNLEGVIAEIMKHV